MYIYYIDDVHGIWRRGQRADHMLYKQIGKEISGFVYNGNLFSLLSVYRNRWKCITFDSGHFVDKNRFVFHVNFFFVDGNHAHNMDSHV